jgi:hypothetical protein
VRDDGRQARSQLSGIGPVEPLTRALKEPMMTAAATATMANVARMDVLLLARDSSLKVRLTADIPNVRAKPDATSA